MADLSKIPLVREVNQYIKFQKLLSEMKRDKNQRRHVEDFLVLRNDFRKTTLYERVRKPIKDGILLPPPILRYRVGGAIDAKEFWEVGKLCTQDLKAILKSVNKDIPSFEHILDFGCGPGRTLIHFNDTSSSSRFYGTDIDSEAIVWCQHNLGQIAQWCTNEAEPPTAYDDDSFDLIYAISVFTHLDEPLQLAWLAELKRILKPGGLLIATIHGVFYSYDNFSSEQKAQINEKGFLYTIGSTGILKLDGLPDFYQTAFHTKDYVDHEWSKFFKIVKYVERGMQASQDAVILSK